MMSLWLARMSLFAKVVVVNGNETVRQNIFLRARDFLSLVKEIETTRRRDPQNLTKILRDRSFLKEHS